jgi:hypothetical protein
VKEGNALTAQKDKTKVDSLFGGSDEGDLFGGGGSSKPPMAPTRVALPGILIIHNVSSM